MEHRLSARFPATGRAIVDGAPIGIVVATVRDVSVGGMFVECGSDVFPVDSLVALSFSLSSDDQVQGFLIPAMVVYAKEQGMGLMFVDDESERLAALHDLIHAERVGALRSGLAFMARSGSTGSWVNLSGTDDMWSQAG